MCCWPVSTDALLCCRYGQEHVLITASSGSAASRIGGTTLHSALGLQRGNKTVPQLRQEMSQSVKENWRNVQVLVIEEYSLISAGLLDLVNSLAQAMKQSSEAFGGVRVMLFGDIAQLAPIDDVDKQPVGQNYQRSAVQYAFDSKVWKEAANFKCFRLTYCWRYDINSPMGEFLTELRTVDQLTPALYKKLEALPQGGYADLEDAETVMLTSKKAEAQNRNQVMLNAIQSEPVTYCGVDRFPVQPHWDRETCKREVNAQLGQGWEDHGDLQDGQILHGQKGSR